MHAARGLRENELEHAAALAGLLDAAHLLQLLDAALHLGCLGCHGAESLHEGLDVGDFALLVAPGCQHLLIALLLQLQEAGVVARVAYQLAVLDVVHRLHQGVHEIAVVRNHEDGSRVVHQVTLEPQQTHQVQVVGRFVQHQQIWLSHQQLGHVGAHHPAAAHFAGRAVEVLVLEGKSFQDTLGLGFNLVTIV